MSEHQWPKFKSGDRVWSVLRNCWVELGQSGGGLHDGRWYYTEIGALVGSESVPLLFRNEIKPEDWPQPKAPLPDLKDGDPIWVRSYADGSWVPKRFAKFSEDGKKLYCYLVGDKWASRGSTESWNHWRLPTDEELKCLSE